MATVVSISVRLPPAAAASTAEAAVLSSGKSAPVFLVGTSRAALSVANAAVYASGHSRPDALVVTSGMLMHVDETQPSVERNVQALDRITQPVLLVFHQLDSCSYTPASSAHLFKSLLTHAARVDIKILEGGERGSSAPCEAKSYHGFLSMDASVVQTITDWLGKRPQ